MKVLLVEHSSNTKISLGAGLESLGYAVDVVADGTAATTSASCNNYDIIILDLMLPKESSLLALHEIRELDPDVDILILSTPEQIHDRVTALIQGADDYLVKPFSIDDLHASIQSLLRRKADSEPERDQVSVAADASTQLNRLIEKLLRLCHCEHGATGLVISEIKLSSLLDRVYRNLINDAASQDIKLSISSTQLPTLLVDARWMEHLLVNLVANAVSQSPRGSEIRIGVNADTEYCTVEIENKMSETFSSDELKTIFRNFCAPGKCGNEKTPIARLSLAKSYADYMNLSLNAWIDVNNHLKIQIANIKII